MSLMALSERYRPVRFVAHSNPDKFSMLWPGADREVRVCRSALLSGPVGLAIAERTAASRFASGNVTFVWAAAVPGRHAASTTDKRRTDSRTVSAMPREASLMPRHFK